MQYPKYKDLKHRDDLLKKHGRIVDCFNCNIYITDSKEINAYIEKTVEKEHCPNCNSLGVLNCQFSNLN